jgi:hypothetical protein
MKFGSEVKKSFTENHRRNYAAFNKSSIFDQVQPVDSGDFKRNMNKMQSKSSFVPKLKEETPFNRKLKEFWSKDEYLGQYGTQFSTRGFIQKENLKANQEHLAKQIKRVGLKSKKEEEKLKVNNPITQQVESSQNEEKKLELSKLKCAKERRLSDLNSNIFNENDKSLKITIQKNKPPILSEEYFWDSKTKIVPTEKKIGEGAADTIYNSSSKYSEIKFNKCKTPSISSAKEMKLHNLFSHFDSEEKKKNINLRSQIEEKHEKDNQEGLEEKFSPHKLVRLSSLTSSFNDKNFLKSNYEKREKQERDVENYEIIMKKGYDTTETHKIKALFTNQG